MKEMALDFFNENKEELINQGFKTFEEYWEFIKLTNKEMKC